MICYVYAHMYTQRKNQLRVLLVYRRHFTLIIKQESQLQKYHELKEKRKELLYNFENWKLETQRLENAKFCCHSVLRSRNAIKYSKYLLCPKSIPSGYQTAKDSLKSCHYKFVSTFIFCSISCIVIIPTEMKTYPCLSITSVLLLYFLFYFFLSLSHLPFTVSN